MNTILRQQLLFVIALILIGICPIILIWVLLMLIFRQIVLLLAKAFRSDLDTLVNSNSTFFACGLVYNTTATLPVLVTLHLDGHLSLEKCQQGFMKALDKVDPISKTLRRRQLRQTVTTFFGLLFWKWETNFKISDHIKLSDETYLIDPASETHLRETDILSVKNDILYKPFCPELSPWEVIVRYIKRDHNKSVQTILTIRLHHALGDGYSILKLICEDLCGKEVTIPESVYTKHQSKPGSIFLQAFLSAKYGFRMVRESSEAILAVLENIPFSTPSSSPHIVTHAVSQKISLEWLKGMKNKHGVSLTTVLLAAFTGGIKRHFSKYGIPIPKLLPCVIVLPLPNHPSTFTNHMTGGFITLPLDEDSALKRLRFINRSLESLRSSTRLFTATIVAYISGLQLACINKLFLSSPFILSRMSNFPGPPTVVDFLGLRVLDSVFILGAGQGSGCAGFCSLSYNQSLRIVAGFEERVVPKSIPAKGFVDAILEELDLFDKIPISL